MTRNIAAAVASKGGMRSVGLLFAVVLGSCTSAEPGDVPGPDVEATVESPRVVEAPAPVAARTPAPSPKVPVRPGTVFDPPLEAWAWAEGAFADRTCLHGCPPVSALEKGARFRNEASTDLGAKGLEFIAFDGEGVPRWRRPLGFAPKVAMGLRTRTLGCGEFFYVAMVRDGRAMYSMARFAQEDGSRGPVQEIQVPASGDTTDHAIQMRCREDSGVSVFGQLRSALGHQVLYMNALSPELEFEAQGVLPGFFAELTPRRDSAAPSDGMTMDYRFSGGESRPWEIGLDARRPKAHERRPAPKHLVLEASSEGETRWTVDLGPALSTDTEVMEWGELTIARVQSELIAVATLDGSIVWRTQPDSLVGLYGCSRCKEPTHHLRLEGDHLILSGFGNQRWINAIEPNTGQIVFRRVWT